MRILIIGGTNFIGPYLVKQLCEMGHSVTVFHRGQTKADLPSGVNYILGDRSLLANFKSEFEKIKPQVVLDAIAFTEQDAIDTMKAFKGIAERVVVISSMDVYRAYGILLGLEPEPVDPVPIRENSPKRSQLYPFRNLPQRPIGTPENYDKILVERAIMGDPDLPGTVVRLPMVYGPKDPLHRLEPYLRRMDDKRPVILLEESIASWRGCYGYVENVANAIALAVTNEQAKDRIYHVADVETLSEADRIGKIGSVAGWQGKVITLPREDFPAEWQLPYNTNQHWTVDSSIIRNELGYREIVPLDEAISKTIDWERANLPQQSNPFAVPYLLDYATEDKILSQKSSYAL
jgi:nucleoside-diphosphate-sugar epimerase